MRPKGQLERVDNHWCEEAVANDSKLEDPFFIKFWESPAWDSSGVDPFDFMDEAVANKRDGPYFFPLGIDALCDASKWGQGQDKLRQGCTKTRRCMIPASVIWQMLPAHDQLIDKA